MELNFTVETKDALLDMVKRHNKMYRMGTPEISDAEYDAEIELLKTLDPNNEWFKHTEPAFVSETRKRALPIPMKSLNKVNVQENTLYDIIYDLFFYAKLQESEEDIKNGRICTLEELRQHIDELEAKYANNNIG